ncbi:MAG: cobalt ECF transporter T component CbiQ [Actinobacteria bacterium]|nr:cobalt ECF transporter T component CbiQ [Actinomycetota bacterium]
MNQTGVWPEWLTDTSPTNFKVGKADRKKGDVIANTLFASASLLRQVMFGEEVASQKGFLQRFDARAKLLGMFSLLIAVAYVRNVIVILIAYLLTLLLAKSSKISIWFFIKRVWLFIPIFSGIIILPSTLSIISPGEVVLHLFRIGHTEIGLTKQGLAGAQIFVMRIALSISLVVLLTLSTKWNELLQSLRILKVPKFFILIVGMAYRYIFLLLGSVVEMYESRRSRTIIKVRNDGGARKFVSATAGSTIGKSQMLANEIHDAMLSRGYLGDTRTLHVSHWKFSDSILLISVLLISVIIYYVDFKLGR